MIIAILLLLIGVIVLGFELLWIHEHSKRKASERECEGIRMKLCESERETASWRKEAVQGLELTKKVCGELRESQLACEHLRIDLEAAKFEIELKAIDLRQAEERAERLARLNDELRESERIADIENAVVWEMLNIYKHENEKLK